MADVIPNIAAGRCQQLYRNVNDNNPAASRLLLVLLQVGDTDANYRDFDTLAALLAGASTECNFTNYARIAYSDADLDPPTVDDTANNAVFGLPLKTIASAGGTLNNDIVRAVLCYDNTGSDADSALIPMIVFDPADVTTNGQTLTVPAAAIVQRSTPS